VLDVGLFVGTFCDTSLCSNRSILSSAVELDVLGPGLYLYIIKKIKIITYHLKIDYSVNTSKLFKI